jgi:hypothetical protein
MQLRVGFHLPAVTAGLALTTGLASRPSAPSPAVTDLRVKIREWTVPTKGADGRSYLACSGVNKVGVGEPLR